MSRQRFLLSEEQVKELIHAYAQSRDGPTRTRLQAVRLYGTGYVVKEIMGITECSRTSLMGWYQKYRRYGLPGLYAHRLGGNRAKLKPDAIAGLRERLHEYTPQALFGSRATTADGQFWTVEDLHQAVRHWYGVTYPSRSSYYRLFALCGFTYQRPAQVFKSRREADVIHFEELVEKN